MDSTSPPPQAGAAGRLNVTLLGKFAVAVDGVDWPPGRWPSLRATHLVQLLSLQPARRATRDKVIDALWPQLAPDAGAANLRKAVFNARQALGRHDAIGVQAGELVLWPRGTIEMDVDTFENQSDRALQQGDAAACADAAGLYPGDLLPGSQYEAWTEPARERLRARFLDLLRASAQWKRLALQEPTDEEAHAALMQQALQAGNRAEALHWYAHAREALQHQLGVAPGTAMQRLHQRCIEGLQSERPIFVGRAQELARTAAWLQQPARRRPGGIVLCGPAGIGKSALGREIEAQACEHGWAVLRADATETGRAYGLTEAIAERLIIEDRSVLDRIGAPARGVLAQITTLAAPAERLPGPLGRHQVVGAVRRLLLTAFDGRDLLLWVDDAHLIEDSDAEVLVQLAMAGAPLCLLIGTRPLAAERHLARGLSRLLRAGVLQRVDVPPLNEADVHRLVQWAAEPSTGTDLPARIAQTAQGNPFAAIELARCAAWADPDHLPASAAEAITDRLCNVAPTTLALLNWLALSGDEIEAVAVETIAAQAQTSAFAALDSALAEGILVVSGTRYRFRHELVRHALLGQIPPHRRIKMHRQIASALADAGLAPARIAAHWQAGGVVREAVPWWLAAAREAMRLAAFGDALRHLDALLAVDKENAEALRLRAEALDAQGDPAALFAYRLAAAAAGEPGSHDLRAKAALAQVKLGDPKGAIVALEGVHPTSVEGRLCEALAWSGAAALGVADPAIGTAKSAVARRLALQTGDTSSLVIASWAQAAAAHARGDLHRSVWADLQETSHVPHLAVRVFDGHLCITQRFLYGARPYPEVIEFAQALATEARRLGAARGLAFGTTLQGEAEWLAGDLAAARVHLREGARLHRAIGGPVGEALSLQRLAEVALHEGHQDEAHALIDEALDLARQTDIGFHLLDRIYGTRISLHGNDPDAALHVMEDASASVRGPLETCPGCRITFAVPAAIAAARAGRIELAHQHEEQAAYLANVVMRLPAWYAAHEEVCAHIGAAEQRPRDETAARFASAAARFQQAGQPLDAARCERLAARAP
ncbi:AAA family ATPase [Hydrogenophaga sp.]|uniref:ATP-binding protein n=1 Tax=Hydrogenophaga sp. TaxID=1904254 RepID=UPI00272FF6A5|nr:AAA family ATPase [Hydrogenophaga sp.]MDP2074428.1 AAA family ATPase [Hydrogenophaga sp.]MDP3108252.1 AAA family ATPase [Hydrogenophaga sp.]MDP3348681.1 AAA family ATPase [Hydrogenophaga sp.]